MGEELGAGGNPVHGLFRDEVGLDRRDAVALDAFYGVQGLEKVEETLAGGASEVAGVDAGEDDFLASCVGDGLGGAHGFADGDIAAAAAGVRHGAVGAEVVTAVLHLQEGTGAPADAVGPEDLCLGRGEGDGFERPKEGEGFGDEARLLVGAEDQRDALDGGDLLPA